MMEPSENRLGELFLFCLFVIFFIFIYFCYFRDRVSCSSGWPGIHHVAKGDLDPATPTSQVLELQHTLPYLADVLLL